MNRIDPNRTKARNLGRYALGFLQSFTQDFGLALFPSQERVKVKGEMATAKPAADFHAAES